MPCPWANCAPTRFGTSEAVEYLKPSSMITLSPGYNLTVERLSLLRGRMQSKYAKYFSLSPTTLLKHFPDLQPHHDAAFFTAHKWPHQTNRAHKVYGPVSRFRWARCDGQDLGVVDHDSSYVYSNIFVSPIFKFLSASLVHFTNNSAKEFRNMYTMEQNSGSLYDPRYAN